MNTISPSPRHTTLRTKMSSIKWLNYLLFMENFLGIYRNYCNQKKIKKCLIIFQIFVQTMLHTILVIHTVYLVLGRDNYNQMKIIYVCFVVFSYVNCVSAVMTAASNSRSFTSYYRSICRVYEWFKDDKKLINSLKKTFYFSITFILFCFMFSAYRTKGALIYFSPSDPTVILIPILVSQVLIRITVVFQNFVLFVVIMIVFHLSKCLTSLISVAQKGLRSCDISSDERGDITREQIQEWVELYRDLANCCEKVTLCFGRQYIYSLAMLIVQYILVMYKIFNVKILNVGRDDGAKISIVIFIYLSVTILPLVAGQIASNQGVKIRRVLVRLYNTMITESGEPEAKLIKDFIRLIKKNPLEIKLSNKIPAGMYMLPVMLTFAVNYLIVMLQFNHII